MPALIHRHPAAFLKRAALRRFSGKIAAMNILFLTQYYPPEFGAAAIRLSRLARSLAADGHRVTVLTSMPNYPEGVIRPEYRRALWTHERMDGVNVHRVWVYASPAKGARSRLMNQFSFLLMAALRGSFLPQPDVLFVESHPLFVTLAGGWLKRRLRAPIVLNVSDLWPESAIATGMLSRDSLIVKVAEQVERWAYADAAHIIAMSEGWRDGILKVHPHPKRVTVIRNGVNLADFRPPTPEERAAARAKFGLSDTFTVIHAGNMSLTYDFDVILEAAARLPKVRFLFAGGGSQLSKVESGIAARGLKNVHLLGVLPHEQMPSVWAAADVSLVTLANHSVAGGTLPAKMYESLATGTPLVAAIQGEGAAMIEAASAGIVVPQGDAPAFAEAIQALAGDPARLATHRAAAAAYARQHLSAESVTMRHLAVFEHAAPGL